MLDEARTTPLAAYMQVASCVPSTGPELETTGASFGPAEVAEALSWGPDMIGLGEVMNFPGVVYGDDVMIGKFRPRCARARWRMAILHGPPMIGGCRSMQPRELRATTNVSRPRM